MWYLLPSSCPSAGPQGRVWALGIQTSSSRCGPWPFIQLSLSIHPFFWWGGNYYSGNWKQDSNYQRINLGKALWNKSRDNWSDVMVK